MSLTTMLRAPFSRARMIFSRQVVIVQNHPITARPFSERFGSDEHLQHHAGHSTSHEPESRTKTHPHSDHHSAAVEARQKAHEAAKATQMAMEAAQRAADHAEQLEVKAVEASAADAVDAMSVEREQAAELAAMRLHKKKIDQALQNGDVLVLSSFLFKLPLHL